MTLIRFTLFSAVVLLITFPAAGQEGESVLVNGGEIKKEAFITGDAIVRLSQGDTVKIRGSEEDYFRVTYTEGGVEWEGWLRKENVMSDDERKKYKKKLRAKHQRARNRRKYLQRLREKGYTIVLARQTFEKNSADGISVGLGLINISLNKTVKYARITWKLFNPVGDPTSGKNTGIATAQTRLVGPLEPGGSGYTDFENVWYSSVGTCVEVHRIEVQHMDGSSYVYVNDLRDIAREAESVRLKGDCSYESQQSRKKH